MESDSDGSKPLVKQKTYINTGNGGKTRSNSLGNVKLSTFQIMQIIGADDNNRPLISDVNKDKRRQKQTSEQTIRGDDERLQDDIPEKENDADLVFKPKQSVFRTPPLKKTGDGNNNKRPRYETSPEETETTKRPHHDQTSTINNQTETQKQAEKTEECAISEEKIIEFYAALDIFAAAIEQEKGELAHISMKNAHSQICKIFTLLIFKQGQIEKENIQLKSKVLIQSEMQKTLENEHQTNNQENRTYAKIASFTPEININQESTSEKQDERKWMTPRTSKKYETVINVQNVTDPKEAMKKLKQNVNVKEVGGAFKNIKQTKSGTIIVESHSKVQQEQLQAAIQKIEDINAKENPINDPMFMITGIEKGFSEGEFIEELIRLNDEVEAELQTSVRDKIKVVTKRQCKNPNKENWILQAPPAISKWFLKRGTVYFDLLAVFVKEYYNLAMCFKCAGFDHVAKYCSQKQCCHKCGAEHEPKECTELFLRCPNCAKMKLEDTSHSARDTNICPVYQRRLSRYKNNINYSTDFQ